MEGPLLEPAAVGSFCCSFVGELVSGVQASGLSPATVDVIDLIVLVERHSLHAVCQGAI